MEGNSIVDIGWLVGWLIVFYGISTFLGYLMLITIIEN